MTIEAPTDRGSQIMLLSIRPRHVAKILDGSKTVELRRGRPNIVPGQPLAIYSTTPDAAIVALGRVSRIEVASPGELWAGVHGMVGISRAEYEDYFLGATAATGLHLSDIRALCVPVSLAELRAPGPFHPPQTWHFLDQERVSQLFGGHAATAAVSNLIEAAS